MFTKFVLPIIAGFLIILGSVFVFTSFQEQMKLENGGNLRISEDTEYIKIGTIHRDPAKMIETAQPIADYLAEKLSNEKTKFLGKIVIVPSIEEMILALEQNEIDLYYDSPLTAIQISEASESIPFLKRWKEGTESYHTVFIVEKNSEINSISDFFGKTIVFQNPESSSGYLLPKAYLIQKGLSVGIDEINDMTYVFSNDDENTPFFVIDGRAQIGAVSNMDFKDFPDGIKSKLKIVGTTSEIPRQILIHRADMDPNLISEIKTILLDMDKNDFGIQVLDDFKHTLKFTDLESETINEIKTILKILE